MAGLVSRFVKRARTAIACAIVPTVGLSGAVLAQDKPLIEKWLDGEVKANYPAITYDGPPIELRWASFLSEFGLDVRSFDRLTQDTNGKLVIKQYWGNSLTDMTRGAFESVSSGIADFGPCLASYSPGGMPLQPGLQAPFKFSSSVQATQVALELYARYLKDDYENKGVYLFKVNMTEPTQILTRTEKIEKLEDMAGKKVWALGSPFVNDMVKSLGGVPVFVPIPETYVAFQSGVVDAVNSHDASYSLFKWNEIGKYHLQSDLWSHSVEFCINKAKFDSLPADLKAIFYHWSQLNNQANAELYFQRTSMEARKSMEKMGVAMAVLTAGEKARWSSALAPALEKFAKENPNAHAGAFFEEMGVLAKKYSTMTNDEITQLILEKPIPGVIDF